MNSSDVKKAVERLQQFLLEEYGLDTKASSNKATEQPTPAELNTIFGSEHFRTYSDNLHKATNRS